MDQREQPSSGFPSAAEPDPEWREYQAWQDRELAAGRDPDFGREPEVWELGDWDAWDPAASAALVAALAPPVRTIPPTAPAGPSSPVASPAGERRLRFGQGDEADVLPPGPALTGLTEEAVRDFDSLSDEELVGVLLAARRQEVRESYKQVLVVAEFARRRETALAAAQARGVPVAWRPGGFPGEELAMELVTTRIQTGRLIDMATDLVTRLPATLAGMAAGLIDEARASWIAYYTHSLTAEDAARADEILAAVAPDLRVDQLARKAAALEMKLDPAAARARKEHEKRANQRVEARREASGNASLSAREMDTADAIASKSYIDAMAAALRGGGFDAPLGTLRVLAMGDLTQGRNPLDRLKQPPAQSAEHDGGEQDGGEQDGDASDVPDASAPGQSDSETAGASGLEPLPALVNLIVPAATLFGWGTGPAQAGSWGLLDHVETHSVVIAASRHPRTRWCVTLTNESGEAIAHACARGQHPWPREVFKPPADPPISQNSSTPPGQPASSPPHSSGSPDPPCPPSLSRQSTPGPVGPPRSHERPDSREASAMRGGPTPEQSMMLRDWLWALNPTFAAIARGTCDHANAEDHYTPSRSLKHRVRARTATCDAPACDAQAIYTDLDHTVAYPAGLTDECNLGPRCRTHHRCKQAPGWKVEQPEPGVTVWTLPSGRTHVTTPTTYEVS